MLQYELESLDSLDDATKKLYKEEGDKFILDVEGIPKPENVDGLKSALQKERDNVKERDNILKEWKKLGESPKAVSEEIKGLKDKRGDPTDHEKAIEQLKEQHKKDMELVETRNETLTKERDAAVQDKQNYRVRGDLSSALLNEGFIKEGIDLLLDSHKVIGRIKVEKTDDGKEITNILQRDLETVMMSSSTDDAAKANGYRATYEDLAKDLAELHPSLVSSDRKGGAGTPPGGGSGNNDKTIKRSEFDNLTAEQKSKIISDRVKITD